MPQSLSKSQQAQNRTSAVKEKQPKKEETGSQFDFTFVNGRVPYQLQYSDFRTHCIPYTSACLCFCSIFQFLTTASKYSLRWGGRLHFSRSTMGGYERVVALKRRKESERRQKVDFLSVRYLSWGKVSTTYTAVVRRRRYATLGDVGILNAVVVSIQGFDMIMCDARDTLSTE